MSEYTFAEVKRLRETLLETVNNLAAYNEWAIGLCAIVRRLNADGVTIPAELRAMILAGPRKDGEAA